jgi:hypothetical protein
MYRIHLQHQFLLSLSILIVSIYPIVNYLQFNRGLLVAANYWDWKSLIGYAIAYAATKHILYNQIFAGNPARLIKGIYDTE